MPNYTTADAKKHNKSLTSKQARQWANVANSAYARCAKKGGKNCDGVSIRIANGVVKKHRTEEVDVLLGFLGEEETQEEVLEGLQHQFCPELFESTVVETQVLEDGTSIEFLDQHSFLMPIEEDSFLPAIGEDISDWGVDKVLYEEEDGKHIAVFRAIQGRNSSKGESGISKNKNFYSGEVAEALAPLLNQRRKMYLNHKLQDKLGRPIEDLAGMINEPWAKEGASFVKTDVLIENPSTGWIWEVMKKYPDQIGVSINAFVKGRRATIDKVAVFAVEAWRFLSSLDFVGEQSAGGTLQSTESIEAQEGMQTEEPGGEEMALTAIQEAFKKSLSTELDKTKRRSALNSVGWLVTDLIRSAAYDRDSNEETRRKNVKTLLKEFSTEIEKLDPVGLYKEDVDRWASYYESKEPPALEEAEFLIEMIVLQDTDDEVVEAILEEASGSDAFTEVIVNEVKFSDKPWNEVDKSKLPASAFLIVGDADEKNTWHLPYQEASGAVNKEALQAIAGVLEDTGGHKFSILPSVKSKLERLLKAAGVGKAAKKELSSSPLSQEEFQVNVEELKALSWEQLVVACPAAATKQGEHTTALSEAAAATSAAETKAQDAETAKVAAEKTATETAKELDELKLKDAVREETSIVSRLLGESKVLDQKDEIQVSEAFRGELLRLAKEGEDAVKKAIEDREALITGEREKRTPGVVGNGQRREPTIPTVEGNGNGSAQVPYTGVPVVESDSKEALVSNLKSHR